jgi:hypothetical protein
MTVAKGQTGGSQIDRREFLTKAGSAGLAVGAMSLPLAGMPLAGQTGSSENPPVPPNIKPLAQLDSRFPVTYRASVPEALMLMTKYFLAFSSRDQSALAGLFHFPFAVYEDTEPIVVDSAAQFSSKPPVSLNLASNGATLIEAGAYDLLDSIELLTYNPVTVVVAMCFTRFGPDGKRLVQCKGIYAITNNDGRWAIQMMSTMYIPADQGDVKFEDAVQAAQRLQHNWMLGYTLRSQELLNSTHQLGKQANVAPPDPRSNAGNARTGKPMDGYRVMGVKTRLHVSDVTPETIAKMDANFPEFASWAGGGVGQWDYTDSLPTSRILHATVNKVHTFGGYVRYTEQSVITSETHVVQIVTYKAGRWGTAGATGIMMYHDRTGDTRP